jgi:1-acyl-sn-glycerol-3-phosphate acyltransferase
LKTVPPRLGIISNVTGTPFNMPCLYVANHISYIDPVIILSYINAFVVAKAEVLRWPLVGLASKIVGTIFVNRQHKSSRLKTALTIREALERGNSILVFPEGTTTKGNATLAFRPRSFESAWLASVPVQPIAIQYAQDEAAFVGDDSFIPHFFRLFRAKEIPVKITFGPVINSSTASQDSKEWIDTVLAPYHSHAA